MKYNLNINIFDCQTLVKETKQVSFYNSLLNNQRKKQEFNNVFAVWKYMVKKGTLSNERSAVPKTKKRGDVNCSGKKLRKQKGTGMARVGSASSPTRRGGAVAFGPNGRNYHQKINYKLLEKFIVNSLIKLFLENKIVILKNHENLLKTKESLNILNLTKDMLNNENKNIYFLKNFDEKVKTFRVISNLLFLENDNFYKAFFYNHSIYMTENFYNFLIENCFYTDMQELGELI